MIQPPTGSRQGINMKQRLNAEKIAFSDAMWIFDEGSFPAFTGENFDAPHRSRSKTGKQRGKFDLRELEKLLSDPEEKIEIKKTDFYRNEKEKNRQNWFAYELALNLHDGYKKELLKKNRNYSAS
jgi:hypothetical protein